MHPRILLLALLPWLTSTARAQSVFHPDYLQGSLLVGRMLRNHPEFPEITATSLAGEFRFGIRLAGDKPWHRSYRNGTLGLAMVFGSMGNDDVLGRFIAVIPELTIPLIEKGKWKIGASLGLGAAWFDKPYDQVDNPHNIAIGSPVTFCALAACNVAYDAGGGFSVALRPVLYHASNSHSNLPNVGMNLPMAGLALRYDRLGTGGPAPPDTSGSGHDRRLHFNTRLGLAFNEFGGATGPADGPKYPIYLISLFLSKKVSPVNKLQAGVEGWYNTGVYDFIVSQDFYTEKQSMNSLAVVLFAGHEFLFGHFSLLTQGGVYLHNPFYRDKLDREESPTLKARLKTWFPARIGLQYYLFDETARAGRNLFVGAYIKTNLGQADFLDTGIGFNF